MRIGIVNNGILENIVVAENGGEYISKISNYNQYVVDLTSFNPEPRIGYSFDGSNFSEPEVPVIEQPPEE